MNRIESLKNIIASSDLPVRPYEIKYATKLFKNGKYNSRITLNVPPYQLAQGIDIDALIKSMEETRRHLNDDIHQTQRIDKLRRARRCKRYVDEIVQILKTAKCAHVQRINTRYTALVAVYFNWKDIKEVIGLIEAASVSLITSQIMDIHSIEKMSIASVVIPANQEHEESLENFTSISESVEYRKHNFFNCYNIRINSSPACSNVEELTDSIQRDLPDSKVRKTNTWRGIYHVCIGEEQIGRLKTILAIDSLKSGSHYTVTRAIIA
jgi:hypothetical protein